MIDANLVVLLVVGYVDQNRIPLFKRTSHYTAQDWEALTAILEYTPRRYSTAHVLSEASNLTDMKGPQLDEARAMLHRAISQWEELPIASLDACRSPYYRRLGLTDAAIILTAQQRGCSVVTSDFGLYLALLEQGASVLNFDDLRKLL
ncbi:MAG TPA: PIN domain-containing protein [Bryobacteraceae bacterium]|nr:PIN domain-containing protein [Bryobacteraceae bacterium]